MILFGSFYIFFLLLFRLPVRFHLIFSAATKRLVDCWLKCFFCRCCQVYFIAILNPFNLKRTKAKSNREMAFKINTGRLQQYISIINSWKCGKLHWTQRIAQRNWKKIILKSNFNCSSQLLWIIFHLFWEYSVLTCKASLFGLSNSDKI